MRTRPPLAIGLLSGAIIGAALLSIHLILIRTIQQQEIGMNLFMTGLLLLITLPLLALWLYSVIELATLRYAVDRNGLTISTWFLRRTIPHGEIREIVTGVEAEADRRFRGVSWPGFMHGRIQMPGIGPLLMLSTEPLERQLVVVTESACYGISPRNADTFLQGYERRRDLGAMESVPHAVEARAVAAWPIWRDRAFWLAMIVGLVANLALVAYATGRYAQLPAIVPMHWDALGHIDRLAPKAWVFSIPAIGALALGVNFLIGLLLSFREQFGSRLLAWASVAVQAGLWLAALEILAP
jgi:hypothetical protein